MPLNLRFGQPGRAWGEQVDHLYPAYDFPFTYAPPDRPADRPHAGRAGPLHGATDTCPRIFHAATALEMWEGRQSLGLTDPLGQRDVPDPAEGAHLHHGQHAARRRAAAAAGQGAVRRLRAAAQSQPAHLDHARAA